LQFENGGGGSPIGAGWAVIASARWGRATFQTGLRPGSPAFPIRSRIRLQRVVPDGAGDTNSVSCFRGRGGQAGSRTVDLSSCGFLYFACPSNRLLKRAVQNESGAGDCHRSSIRRSRFYFRRSSRQIQADQSVRRRRQDPRASGRRGYAVFPRCCSATEMSAPEAAQEQVQGQGQSATTCPTAHKVGFGVALQPGRTDRRFIGLARSGVPGVGSHPAHDPR